MSFSGKASYSAGATLPEVAEDISDLVAINSPHETPLLDALGDPARSAHSTVHEWLEDSLLPNSDAVVSLSSSSLVVSNVGLFRVGDQLRPEGNYESMLVTAVNTGTSTLTVTRGYGGTTQAALSSGAVVRILGNAALEGDDAGASRFVSRSRQTNYTQILSATLEVSGSELAVRKIGVRDELDYMKTQRTRELLRDLENSVINGVAPSSNAQGSGSVRRTMRGLLSSITTHRYEPGTGIDDESQLTEAQLNQALANIWSRSAGKIDLIVVGGSQKRAINSFSASSRRFDASDDRFSSLVNVYESDYGVCRVVLSRYMPPGTVLLLDSSRIDVLPLAGRSFHYKHLASTGDRESGMVVGEYTVEIRNESAHGVISGLD